MILYDYDTMIVIDNNSTSHFHYLLLYICFIIVLCFCHTIVLFIELYVHITVY